MGRQGRLPAQAKTWVGGEGTQSVGTVVVNAQCQLALRGT